LEKALNPTHQNGRILLHVAPGNTMAEVSAHRYFSAHHMMIWAAKAALPNAVLPQNALVVIAMCSMAAEALANAVGTRIFTEWKDFDQLSPWGKYRLICRELKIPCNKGEEVWQNLKALLNLRNKIAHAKPEQISGSSTMTVAEYNSGIWHGFPPSKLERELTMDRATGAVATIETILKTIVESLTGDDREFIAGDIAQQEIALAYSDEEAKS
jgi:hypothetical protein